MLLKRVAAGRFSAIAASFNIMSNTSVKVYPNLCILLTKVSIGVIGNLRNDISKLKNGCVRKSCGGFNSEVQLL